MATEIKLPRLGQGMESGTIVKWLKSEGDRVERGEPLYELDTDKVTQEVEAEASGLLLKIAVPEGEVPVGRTIAVIGNEGDEVQAPAESTEVEPAPEPQAEPRAPAPMEEAPEPAVAAAEPPPEVAPPSNGARVKASPLARRIARELGIDLAAISGTGPDGRIVAEDVEKATPPRIIPPAPGAAEAPERIPLSPLRKTIARRMTEAWEAPVFQIALTVDMTRALALRERMLERAGDKARPTISDVLTKVCAAALMRHRAVNARFAGDSIERFASADIGIAVAIPDGLVVPVIHGCERLSIGELAAARAAVVERARSGKLTREDVDGGTFTISNLGMYGVERFVAVVNPPQAAILAVGAIVERPVVHDGEIVVAPILELTLTCDHRALDGATAADFLRTVKEFLEDPELML